MKKEKLYINHIPVIVWGNKSNHIYIYVHGKMQNKDIAEHFAKIAEAKGYQTISFDLPKHGERKQEKDLCNIFNGQRDLQTILDYVQLHWQEISLFACSIGAYFSLSTYKDVTFKKCLFQSPIVNMEQLIKDMMQWFDVSINQLEKYKEIETPIETLSWDYLQYVKEHPITRWTCPTYILYAAKDNLQSYKTMNEFAENFHCFMTVSKDSEHTFMNKKDFDIINTFLIEYI